MKRPTVVEADFAQVERLFDQFRSVLEQLAQLLFALVADLQLAAGLKAMAAGTESQRPHFDRHGLQGNPGRDRLAGFQRPILLVGMPGSDAAAGFLVERLIVIEPHAARAHQFGRQPGQPLGKDQFLDHRAVGPDVHDLQERLLIGRPLVHRQIEGIQFPHALVDDRSVMLDHRRRQHVLQLDVTLLAEELDLLGSEGIGAVEIELRLVARLAAVDGLRMLVLASRWQGRGSCV